MKIKYVEPEGYMSKGMQEAFDAALKKNESEKTKMIKKALARKARKEHHRLPTEVKGEGKVLVEIDEQTREMLKRYCSLANIPEALMIKQAITYFYLDKMPQLKALKEKEKNIAQYDPAPDVSDEADLFG